MTGTRQVTKKGESRVKKHMQLESVSGGECLQGVPNLSVEVSAGLREMLQVFDETFSGAGFGAGIGEGLTQLVEHEMGPDEHRCGEEQLDEAEQSSRHGKGENDQYKMWRMDCVTRPFVS